MPRPDGTTSPGHPRTLTTDDPFALPTHYLFQDKKRRRAPPRHARIPSLLLDQFSSFETFGSPPPTYSSQPPPPSPPAIIDDESDHSDSDTHSHSTRSLTHDGSKDILIERLSHIIRHLQITTDTGDMVDELHSKVDEMYGVMGKFLCFDGRSTTGDPNIFGPLSHTTTQSTGGKPTPTGWTHYFRDPIPTPPPQPQKEKDLTPLLTAEIASLNTQLSTVLQSLRTRKEETDKIQSALLTHLSDAASHILTLESTLTTLTADLRSSDAALRHLRLELRAVETLWRSSPAGEEVTRSCMSSSFGSSPATGGGGSPRTPGGGATGTVDMELVRSIENWKADWRELRGRVAARRGEGGGTPTRGAGECGAGFTPTRSLGGAGEVVGSPARVVTGRPRGEGSVLGSPGPAGTMGRLRDGDSVASSPAVGVSARRRLRGEGSGLGSPFRRPVGGSF